MLTSITLQNFKGIGEKMTIPLRPITLLFGANSTGKSTIVQAIHFAREVLERRNLNPDRTMSGGATVNLGGFLNLLHKRDTRNKMLLRFDFSLEEYDLPFYDGGGFADEHQIQETISSQVRTAWVEMEIEWSEIVNNPVITRYETGLNGIAAAQLITKSDRADCWVSINPFHPLFEPEAEAKNVATDWQRVEMIDLTPQIPVWSELLLAKEWPADISFEKYDVLSFSLVLTQMLTGAGEMLRNTLRQFRYLGPLRKTPPRNHTPALTVEEEDWANGIAAWDTLYRNGKEFVSEVGNWLADKDRLKTGYSLRLKEYREISADSPLLNELLIALRNETFYDNYDLDYFEQERERYPIKQRLVLVEEDRDLEVVPYDIGVGISQLLPVVVAALGTRSGILAIEQPELHLHPAVQTRLGDLFIESALGQTKNMLLLETHSEHLILRLLRRIRETTAGDVPEETLPITPEDLQVLYVKPEAGATRLFALPITPDGDFAVKWPDGFFEERAEEIF
jgi:hypothetical protein